MRRRKFIERALKIDGIWDEAKAAARAAGLDNIQSALLAIAEERSREAQLVKVSEIVTRRAAPRKPRSHGDNVEAKEARTQDVGAGGTTVWGGDASQTTAAAGGALQNLTPFDEAALESLFVHWNEERLLKRDALEAAPTAAQYAFFRALLDALPVVHECFIATPRKEVARGNGSTVK